MRAIKFRAWDTDTKLMEYESLLTIARRNEDADEEVYKLMQYTGLKDKNGTEIYEGDIIYLFDPRPDCKKKISTVTFQNGSFLVNTQMNALPDRTSLEPLYSHFKWREYSECEVIGNIYETPELLEAGDAS